MCGEGGESVCGERGGVCECMYLMVHCPAHQPSHLPCSCSDALIEAF